MNHVETKNVEMDKDGAMMNVVQKMQFKNAVERVLHVPGNYSGGILEMALVCDYHMPEKELRERTAEIADTLKRQSEVFRNVRLNVIKWVSDGQICKEVVPMAYARMGTVFQDYGQFCGGETGDGSTVGGRKTLQELTRQLKLFYARSKLILMLTDGSYTTGDVNKVKANLQPFLHKKMLILQGDKILTGTEMMFEMMRKSTEQNAVIFDMDGVLFDTERVYAEVYEEIAVRRGLGDVREAVLGCIGRNANDSRQFFMKCMGEDFPYESYISEVIARYRERETEEGLPMKPGVRELLEYLKKEHFRIGLASSTRRAKVLTCIERAGIADYFEIVVGGDAVEHSKPEPDIYLIACRELGTEPAETYAIEDSPNGIRSAHGAGMKTIMVPDMIQPDQEIEGMVCRLCHDLTEVKYFLAGRSIKRIPLEKLANTRDLGGIPTENGRQICPHRLLRSGALVWSTEKDREVLTGEYGLKTIIDFRTGPERAEKPDPELPGVKNIWNPILEESAMGITREENQENKSIIQQVLEKTGGDPKGPEEYMRNMYRNLVDNDYSRRQYRRFFEILLEQQEGSVLWHCSAGKDRVGVATALLLSALGVSRERIMTDYIKTNDFGREDVAVLMDKVKPEFRAAIRMLFIVMPSFLNSVFDTIDEEFGGMDAFLEQEMGLTPDRLDRLRDMYLL